MATTYFYPADPEAYVNCKTCLYFKTKCAGNDRGCKDYIHDR